MSTWLDDIRVRAAAATAGPWSYACTGEKDNSWAVGVALDPDTEEPIRYDGSLNDWEDARWDGEGDPPESYVVDEMVCENEDATANIADAAFIAAARDDVPRLLRCAEALEKLVRLKGRLLQDTYAGAFFHAFQEAEAALRGDDA